MKKIILILSLIVFVIVVNAQGNLQFNQVKLITTVQTVPVGKVWKVESCGYNGGAPFLITNFVASGTTCSVIGNMSYIVNGTNNYLFNYENGLSMGTSSGITASPFPLWLPAGTTLAAGTNMSFLSVMEFNIVQ